MGTSPALDHVPMKSILDPTFRYIPAANTDIAATFRRIRREQAAERKHAESTTAKVRKEAQ